MRGRNTLFLAILSIFLACALPFITLAKTAFEGVQDGSVRTSLDLSGGYVHDLDVGPDGTAYVGFNSPNGFFYSTDQGATWNGLPSGMDIGNIANVEVSNSSVFVIAGINLYRSQDGCATFETLSPIDVGNALYYGQGKLFVGMRDGSIEISSDEGATFTKVTVDSSVESFNMITAAATTADVYALGQTSSNGFILFQSTDSGSTWINTGITTATSVAVKPTDANFIVLSGSPTTYSTTGISGTFTTLASNSSGSVLFSNDRIYLGNQYTDNNGATWTIMAETTNSNLQVKSESIAQDPNNSNVLYIESMVGVAKTTDNGLTWTDANNGLTGITVNKVAQSTNDPDLVWVAAYGGLAKSTNFTNLNPTWTFPIAANNSVDFATAVWLDPDNDNYLVAAMLDVIYYSSDAGTTWIASNSALNGNTVSEFLENNSILYAAYHNGIIKSTDNGVTWADAGISDMIVNALVSDSSGNIYAGVGGEWDTTATKRGIYKYDGVNWTQLSGSIDGYMINDILVVDDILYAAAGETSAGSVFKSSDAGATWDDLTANGLATDGWYHALAVDPLDNNILYVSTARPAGTGTVYKTADAGNSWNIFYTGLKDETFNAMIFSTVPTSAASRSAITAATEKNRGLVSGTNTGVYVLQSNAKLIAKASKSSVHNGNKVKITATLKDYSTLKALKNKKVKLYIKYKKHNSWKYSQWLSTNKKGKALFTLIPEKTAYYQLRWKPLASKDRNSYGYDVVKSKRIRVKVSE